MSFVDKLLAATRLLAACSVMMVVTTFPTPDVAFAGLGGCLFHAEFACVTPGFVRENRTCGPGAENCLTCIPVPSATCYCDDGPPLDDFYSNENCPDT